MSLSGTNSDAILKERLYGVGGNEGNHGEDVKEYYFYLDNTPTHSYMKFLYKYPQDEFPYERLKNENLRRDKSQPEFELIDTGIFDEDKYFDVFVEYAKADAEDICIKITAVNRSDEAAPLHILPTVWFRNTWVLDENAEKPHLEKAEIDGGKSFRHSTCTKRNSAIMQLDLRRRVGAVFFRKRNELTETLRRRKRFAVCQRRHQ